jgi:hypothetical protein
METRLKEVDQLADKGDLAGAEKSYRAAAEVVPSYGGLDLRRGMLVEKRIGAVEACIAKFAFDDAKKQLDALKRLDPKNAKTTALEDKFENEKEARGKFDMNVANAEKKLSQPDADVAEIEMRINKAAEKYPKDPKLDPLRKGAAGKRLDIAARGLAKEDLDEAEKNIKAAEALAPAEGRVAELTQQLKDIRGKREKFKNLVADIRGDLAKKDSDPVAIEKKVGDAAGLYKDDPEIATLRDLIESKKKQVDIEALLKKQADFKKELDEADALIKAASFDKAEARIAAADAILPNNAQATAARARLTEKREAARKKAAEDARRAKFDAGLKLVDGMLKQADTAQKTGKLDDAEKRLDESEKSLADAAKEYPDDPEVAGYRTTLGAQREEIKRGRFENTLTAAKTALKSVDDVLGKQEIVVADAETGAAAAAKLLDQARTFYPNDAALKPLADKLAAHNKAIADEKDKRGKFQAALKQADEVLKAPQFVEADAKKAIGDAEALYPNDKAIPGLRDILKNKIADANRSAAEKAQREQFLGLVKKADDGLQAAQPDFATVEKNIADAAAMVKDDPALKAVRDKLAAKKEDLKKAQAAALKAQLDEKVKAIGALLTAGDVAKADTELAAAEKAFNNDALLTPLRQQINAKLGEKKKRTDFEAFVKAADASLTANDLAKAEASLTEAARLFPGDALLAPVQKKLTDAKTAQAATAAARKAEEDRKAAEARKAEEARRAAEAAKKKPEPTQPTPTTKKRRLGEEDVE